MRPEIIGLMGIVLMLLLMFFKLHIGLAMAFTGFIGTLCLLGPAKTMSMLATVPYSSVASYMTSPLPMFLFMGAIVTNTGVGAELYQTGYKLMGQMRGGAGHGYGGSLRWFCGYLWFQHGYCCYYRQGGPARDGKIQL